MLQSPVSRRDALVAGAALALGSSVPSALRSQQWTPVRGIEAATREKVTATLPCNANVVAGFHEVQATPYFRILQADRGAVDPAIGEIAERIRAHVRQAFFLPGEPDWPEKCDLYLCRHRHTIEAVMEQEVTVAGASRLNFESLRRQIAVLVDNWGLKHKTLPHEVTHATLLGLLGKKHTPRWLDEGCAIRAEAGGPQRFAAHMLALFENRVKVYLAADLFTMKEYPAQPHTIDFYAHSSTLVEFLLTRGDERRLRAFARDGVECRSGYDAAARRYGFSGTGELHLAWGDFVWRAPGLEVIPAPTSPRRRFD